MWLSWTNFWQQKSAIRVLEEEQLVVHAGGLDRIHSICQGRLLVHKAIYAWDAVIHMPDVFPGCGSLWLTPSHKTASWAAPWKTIGCVLVFCSFSGWFRGKPKGRPTHLRGPNPKNEKHDTPSFPFKVLEGWWWKPFGIASHGRRCGRAGGGVEGGAGARRELRERVGGSGIFCGSP